MESNDSPEIPDRGETSDISGLPLGEPQNLSHTHHPPAEQTPQPLAYPTPSCTTDPTTSRLHSILLQIRPHNLSLHSTLLQNRPHNLSPTQHPSCRTDSTDSTTSRLPDTLLQNRLHNLSPTQHPPAEQTPQPLAYPTPSSRTDPTTSRLPNTLL